ncbi:hypothetical protein ACBJ59_04605 [Nonomuraea sp. MTCD27]|uniref:hypothetical protein n=1 Tax=Nonomuraea sp. MTCD27 TaxID=1676747 RepID=UPI0035BFE8AD
MSPLYQPGSLHLHLQQRAGAGVSLTWSLQVLDHVLAGLQAAAASGIIHLDIKPQNIVLTAPSPSGSPTGECPSCTRRARAFASPEQLGAIDAAPGGLSDLYGVGALAYWLLAGQAPLRREFETAAVGADADLLQVRHLMQVGTRPERADRLTPDVSEQLGRLIDQWLSSPCRPHPAENGSHHRARLGAHPLGLLERAETSGLGGGAAQVSIHACE